MKNNSEYKYLEDASQQKGKKYGSIRWDNQKNCWKLKAPTFILLKAKNFFEGVNKNEFEEISFSNYRGCVADINWFMIRYPLTVNKEDLKRYETSLKKNLEERKQIDSLEDFHVLKNWNPKPCFEFNCELREYQKEAVLFAKRRKRMLIADQVGLGKTVIGLGIIAEIKSFPALIVGQTHLPIHWKKQFEKFTSVQYINSKSKLCDRYGKSLEGDLETKNILTIHEISQGKNYKLPKADIYITRYSLLAKWGEILSDLVKSVYFDEIQELRHNGTLKYENAEFITKKLEYVFGFTATPVYNKGAEIYNIMKIIDEQILGGYGAFCREWKVYDGWLQHGKELGEFLRNEKHMIRRLRSDPGVNNTLKPVSKYVEEVNIDEKSEKDFLLKIKELAYTSLNAKDPFLRGRASGEFNMLMRMQTGVSKAKSIAENIKVFLEAGEKVLLFGWHREVYEIWKKEFKLYNPLFITGSENAVQKELNKEKFIESKSHNLMIMSLRSGVGIDGLQDVCSIVAFGELDWSPQIHEQAEGRLYRDGQSNNVMSYYYVNMENDSVDPFMMDRLGLKKDQADNILGSEKKTITKQEMLEITEKHLQNAAKKILENYKIDSSIKQKIEEKNQFYEEKKLERKKNKAS